ncbi:MAG: N-acetylmuramic acid 6-phosphate etherase [Ignavibacteria bacterium]|nr:N-acetylmuramic acid 6-phosphate etherase [Ignavibacteria bacterium]
MNQSLRDELASLMTEQRNPASERIDELDAEEILRIISDEDLKVATAVRAEIPYIAKAVELVTASLRSGGRLVYVGAGTSGRLGVLDAAECPPTFGSAPEQIIGIIAGGDAALKRSIEGAEDRPEQGSEDLRKAKVNNRDTVCGIAASRRTPYVLSAIREARSIGAKTVFVTTNPRDSFRLDEADVCICPVVGPEVVTGSTRMKSGTAQKLVLNMITTAAMIQLGKVYGNLMVDLQLTNEKLLERARRILMSAGNVTYDAASKYLSEADGHVKTALVMILGNLSLDQARRRLEAAGGFVRKAVKGDSLR